MITNNLNSLKTFRFFRGDNSHRAVERMHSRNCAMQPRDHYEVKW